MQRINLDIVKQIFKDNGLILLENQYVSVDTPMVCKDIDGYLFFRSLRTVRHDALISKQNFKHRFSKRNKFYWENILHYMEQNVNNGTVLLSNKEDYINNETKLIFKCGECGKHFKISILAFSKREYKICPDCYKQNYKFFSQTEKRRHNFDFYNKIAKERNIKILSNIILNYKDKIDLEDYEGYKGRMSVSRFIQGSNFERFSCRNPYSIENLNLFAKKKNWDCKILEQEFKGTNYPLKIKCSCGQEFITNCDHFLQGKYRCNKCSCNESLISIKVKKWLKSQNIAFEVEKSFEGCVYKKHLKFDFYLIELKKCIEVDGLQHFKPIDFSHNNREKAEQNFETIQIRDSIKNDFCKKNNIPLLRLPYWEIDDNEIYIKKLMQFCF